MESRKKHNISVRLKEIIFDHFILNENEQNFRLLPVRFVDGILIEIDQQMLKEQYLLPGYAGVYLWLRSTGLLNAISKLTKLRLHKPFNEQFGGYIRYLQGQPLSKSDMNHQQLKGILTIHKELFVMGMKILDDSSISVRQSIQLKSWEDEIITLYNMLGEDEMSDFMYPYFRIRADHRLFQKCDIIPYECSSVEFYNRMERGYTQHLLTERLGREHPAIEKLFEMLDQ